MKKRVKKTSRYNPENELRGLSRKLLKIIRRFCDEAKDHYNYYGWDPCGNY